MFFFVVEEERVNLIAADRNQQPSVLTEIPILEKPTRSAPVFIETMPLRRWQ
jgi:hypothetical protein